MSDLEKALALIEKEKLEKTGELNSDFCYLREFEAVLKEHNKGEKNSSTNSTT